MDLARTSSASQKLDFPAYDGTPSTYIVASQPRSGSHLLCQLLYRTRLAGCPLEYFHARHWEEWCNRCRRSNPGYVVGVLLRRRTSPNGIFGCKMHWNQFGFFLKLGLETRFHDAKFIYLTREDVLGQAISHAIAMQTGQWTSFHKARRKHPVYSHRAVARSLRLVLDQRRMWETFFAHAGIVPLRVTYEELTKDRKAVTGRILEYLGVKEVPSDEVIGADPIAVQRTAINEEWRNRFLSSVELRYDSSQRWRGMLEWDLAAEVAGAGKSSSESSA